MALFITEKPLASAMRARAPESRVALTLRSVAGLTTREIARALSTSEPTMQQRIVRTKQRIATARIPYRVPEADELPERLTTVHSVIYAIFTEGYAATEHPDFVRVDLVGEAIRLSPSSCSLCCQRRPPRIESPTASPSAWPMDQTPDSPPGSSD